MGNIHERVTHAHSIIIAAKDSTLQFSSEKFKSLNVNMWLVLNKSALLSIPLTASTPDSSLLYWFVHFQKEKVQEIRWNFSGG